MSSQVDFESAAQSITIETLREVIKLRPKALWGVSPYPSCYNGDPAQTLLANYTGRCPAAEMALNDKLLWLWKRCSALFPLLTLEKLQVRTLTRTYTPTHHTLANLDVRDGNKTALWINTMKMRSTSSERTCRRNLQSRSRAQKVSSPEQRAGKHPPDCRRATASKSNRFAHISSCLRVHWNEKHPRLFISEVEKKSQNTSKPVHNRFLCVHRAQSVEWQTKLISVEFLIRKVFQSFRLT